MPSGVVCVRASSELTGFLDVMVAAMSPAMGLTRGVRGLHKFVSKSVCAARVGSTRVMSCMSRISFSIRVMASSGRLPSGVGFGFVLFSVFSCRAAETSDDAIVAADSFVVAVVVVAGSAAPKIASVVSPSCASFAEVSGKLLPSAGCIRKGFVMVGFPWKTKSRG